MKRLLVFLTMLVLLLPMICYAEIDYASMTTEELVDVINRAKLELEKRTVVVEKDVVLLEKDGYGIYFTGKSKVYYETLEYEVYVVNNTPYKLYPNDTASHATINGWEVFMLTPASVMPGEKKMTTLKFDLSDANISTYEEIEELVFTIYVSNLDTYEEFMTTEPIVLIAK